VFYLLWNYMGISSSPPPPPSPSNPLEYSLKASLPGECTFYLKHWHEKRIIALSSRRIVTEWLTDRLNDWTQMSELTSPILYEFRFTEMTRLEEVSTIDWLSEKMYSFSVGCPVFPQIFLGVKG
jgi:hypothetical protein